MSEIKDLFCACWSWCMGSKNHAPGSMFKGLFYIKIVKMLVKVCTCRVHYVLKSMQGAPLISNTGEHSNSEKEYTQ